MVKDIFDKELEEVYGLSEGTRKWTMCVPAESTDSDVLLCDALRFGKEACALLVRCLPQLEDRCRSLEWYANESDYLAVRKESTKDFVTVSNIITEINNVLKSQEVR